MARQSLEVFHTVVLTADQVNVVYAGLWEVIDKFQYSDDVDDLADVERARQVLVHLDGLK